MMKDKKIISMAVIVLMLMGSTIVFARSDMRFIMVNTWSQLTTGSDLEEIEIEEQKLNKINIEEIKNNQTGIRYNNTLVLVNKDYPIKQGMDFELVDYKDSGLQMERSLVEPYDNLSSDVERRTGDKLYIKSSYRTGEEQEILYSQNKKTAAMPGTSEHEAGLGLDVYIEFFAGNRSVLSV